MVPFVGDSGHLLFGHAMFTKHVPAQAVHISIRLVTAWTSRVPTVLLHMID